MTEMTVCWTTNHFGIDAFEFIGTVGESNDFRWANKSAENIENKFKSIINHRQCVETGWNNIREESLKNWTERARKLIINNRFGTQLTNLWIKSFYSEDKANIHWFYPLFTKCISKTKSTTTVFVENDNQTNRRSQIYLFKLKVFTQAVHMRRGRINKQAKTIVSYANQSKWVRKRRPAVSNGNVSWTVHSNNEMIEFNFFLFYSLIWRDKNCSKLI